MEAGKRKRIFNLMFNRNAILFAVLLALFAAVLFFPLLGIPFFMFIIPISVALSFRYRLYPVLAAGALYFFLAFWLRFDIILYLYLPFFVSAFAGLFIGLRSGDYRKGIAVAAGVTIFCTIVAAAVLAAIGGRSDTLISSYILSAHDHPFLVWLAKSYYYAATGAQAESIGAALNLYAHVAGRSLELADLIVSYSVILIPTAFLFANFLLRSTIFQNVAKYHPKLIWQTFGEMTLPEGYIRYAVLPAFVTVALSVMLPFYYLTVFAAMLFFAVFTVPFALAGIGFIFYLCEIVPDAMAKRVKIANIVFIVLCCILMNLFFVYVIIGVLDHLMGFRRAYGKI